MTERFVHTRDPMHLADDLAAAAGDLPELLGVIARGAAELVGEASVLTLLSEDGRELEPVAFHHDDPEVVELIRQVLSAEPTVVGEGVAGIVASERRPAIIGRLDPAVLADLVQESHRPFVDRHPLRSLAIVPLVADGQLLGTLGVVRTESEVPYGPGDLAAVEALAELAGRALAEATQPPPFLGAHDHEVLFRLGLDGALVADADGRVLSANPAACTLLARPLADFVGLDIGEILVDDAATADWRSRHSLVGSVRSEITMRRLAGGTFPAQVASARYTTAMGEVRSALVFRDLSEEAGWRVQLEQQAELLLAASERDPLTDLLNRRGFHGAAEEALAIAAREGACIQLLFFDLDDLKRVNDSRGHGAGDDVIRHFARALAMHTRASDVAARMGGDEFVLLLFAASATDAEVVVERIEEAFTQGAERTAGGFSVGAAELHPGSDDSLDALVERADRRMYEQKVRRRFGGGAAR